MTENITLRPATLQDADLLLEWRNDPATRLASHDTAETPRDAHYSWLTESLSNPHRKLFIAQEIGVDVGTLRADFSDGAWTLSWTVAPAARGRGVAKRMVAMLAQQIREPLRAEIKVENTASARVAEHAGLKYFREINGVLHYRRDAL